MNKRAPKVQNNPADESGTKLRTLLRDLWFGSCARLTVLCAALLLLCPIIGQPGPEWYRFLLIYPFALFLAGAAAVRRAGQMTTVTKCILHPVLTLGGFYLCCYLPYQLTTKPSGAQVLLVLLLVGVLYAVVMGIYLAVTSALRRKKGDAVEYVSQFGKKS